MKKFQYILLDWDGCLAKTLDLWLKNYQKQFKKYGINLTDKEIVKKVFGDWNAPAKYGVKDPKAFMDALVADLNKDLRSVRLYDGVKETLSKLNKKQKVMALLTSSRKSSAKPALEKHGLSHIFQVFLGAEEVKKHKPDPELFNKALELLQASKRDTIVVGDNPDDVQAGKSAGLTTLTFYPKENSRFYTKEELLKENPDYFIEDFRKLTGVVG